MVVFCSWRIFALIFMFSNIALKYASWRLSFWGSLLNSASKTNASLASPWSRQSLSGIFHDLKFVASGSSTISAYSFSAFQRDMFRLRKLKETGLFLICPCSHPGLHFSLHQGCSFCIPHSLSKMFLLREKQTKWLETANQNYDVVPPHATQNGHH